MGPDAKGLSASSVARLKQTWRAEYEAWGQRHLDDEQRVYVWVGGIDRGIRAEQQRLYVLVVIGVNARDEHFLAIEDGIRESTQSWREVLLHLKAQRLNAPAVAVDDGSLGVRAAVEELYPPLGRNTVGSIRRTMA